MTQKEIQKKVEDYFGNSGEFGGMTHREMAFCELWDTRYIHAQEVTSKEFEEKRGLFDETLIEYLKNDYRDYLEMVVTDADPDDEEEAEEAEEAKKMIADFEKIDWKAAAYCQAPSFMRDDFLKDMCKKYRITIKDEEEA